jgi:hypothetical protein
MIVFGFFILVLLIVLLDAPKLVIERNYKELLVYSFFLLIGLYLGMVQLFDWPFYNPIVEWAIMSGKS